MLLISIECQVDRSGAKEQALDNVWWGVLGGATGGIVAVMPTCSSITTESADAVRSGMHSASGTALLTTDIDLGTDSHHTW